MTTFRVQVTKDYLVFAAAHFITFAGHRCESLHGHNYRVSVALEGTLDPESWYVFNFVDLKQVMKRLCDEIDHRVLLPLENPKLQIGEQAESITVAYQGRPRYVFPREDCVLLPIPNTTGNAGAVSRRSAEGRAGGERRPARVNRDRSRGELRSVRGIPGDFVAFARLADWHGLRLIDLVLDV
jgi:6-pyruvoyl tetrahydropterin synthase/QueD family protein